MNLTPAELAARIRTTTGTLANWRAARPRIGPPFWKPSPKKVLYRLAEVEQWEKDCDSGAT